MEWRLVSAIAVVVAVVCIRIHMCVCIPPVCVCREELIVSLRQQLKEAHLELQSTSKYDVAIYDLICTAMM